MQVQQRFTMGNLDETKKFAKWVLKIRDSTISGPNDGEANPNEIPIQ